MADEEKKPSHDTGFLLALIGFLALVVLYGFLNPEISDYEDIEMATTTENR